MNLVPFLITAAFVIYESHGDIFNDDFLIQLKQLDARIADAIKSMEHIIQEQNKTIQDQRAIINAQV